MSALANHAQFVTALSFEDRSVTAVTEWSKSARDGTLTVLDYGQDATSGDPAQEAREANYRRIRTCVSSDIRVIRKRVNPYSTGDIERSIRAIEERATEITIDISCMTRPHVIGTAIALSHAKAPYWSIAYTAPGSYGQAANSFDWRDTLVIPLGEDSVLENQGLSLGLLLLGFETGRITIALDELESDAGIVLTTRNARRPDFTRLVERKSRDLVEHLERVAMPGTRAEEMLSALPTAGWSMQQSLLTELPTRSKSIVQQLISAATSIESELVTSPPIIMYPFGPKIAVFSLAYYLAKDYARHSWVVYPVAKTHNVDYSHGEGDLLLFSASEFA